MDHIFEFVKNQIAFRFGREPRTTAEMAEAIALLDTPVVAALGARLAMKKALSRPRLDFATFGGTRGTPMTDVPLTEGASDDGPVDRATLDQVGEALDRLNKVMLDGMKADVEAFRRDVQRGAPLAKRTPARDQARDLLSTIENALRAIEEDT